MSKKHAKPNSKVSVRVSDDDPYGALLDDFSLHNLLQNVNHHDVEVATRGEILLIQGRRRRIRIPDSEEEIEDQDRGEEARQQRPKRLVKIRGQLNLQQALRNRSSSSNSSPQRKPSLMNRLLQWKDYIFPSNLSESREGQEGQGQTMGDSFLQDSTHNLPLPKYIVDEPLRRTGGCHNIKEPKYSSPKGPLGDYMSSYDNYDLSDSETNDYKQEITGKMYTSIGCTGTDDKYGVIKVMADYQVGLATVNLDSQNGVNGDPPKNQKPRKVQAPGTGRNKPRRDRDDSPSNLDSTNEDDVTTATDSTTSNRKRNNPRNKQLAIKTTTGESKNITLERKEDEEHTFGISPNSSDTSIDFSTRSRQRRKAGASKPEKIVANVKKFQRKRRAKKSSRSSVTKIKQIEYDLPSTAPSSSTSIASLSSLIPNYASTNPPSLSSFVDEGDDVPISKFESSNSTSYTTIPSKMSLNENKETHDGQDRRSQDSATSNIATGRSFHEYFRDSEISSDISASPDDERDDEWLQYSNTSDHKYEEGDDILTEHENDNSTRTSTAAKKLPQDDCLNMMKCLLLLYTFMKYTGRLPVKVLKKEGSCHVFEFNRRSKDFWMFCLSTCFVTFCCLSIMLNLFLIVETRQPFTFYEDIVALEFDKYWLEAMLTALSLFLTSVWSLAIIFETGIFLGEYLTRWNLCIQLLKYDVTERLREFLLFGYAIYGVYSIILIILFFFGGESIPTVKGASGFIALTIFQPFIFDIRVHGSYFIMEYVGLVIHLYSVLCAGYIVLMILAYAKALENAARRFNLRLAYALRKIALPDENGIYRTVYRVIPFSKLFSEHIVVTSFARHMGKTFGVALNVFYTTKLIGMVMTLYVFVNPMLNGFPEFNETYLNVSVGHGQTGVPILNAEPAEVIMGKSVYFVCECWLIFFVVSELLGKAGDTIMNGFGFIRRHGMFMCKSSVERRFITSMENSFAPTNSYYINPGFSINREAVLVYIGVVLAIWVFLIQFSPSRLKSTTSVVCNDAGECEIITYNRYWELSIGKIGPPVLAAVPSTTATKPTTTVVPPLGVTGSPKFGRYGYPPCVPNGATPIEILDFAYTCDPLDPHPVYIPLIFEKTTLGLEMYYDAVLPPCIDPEAGQRITGTIHDCFGKLLPIKELTEKEDECKRFKLSTPDVNEEASEPVVDLAVVSLVKYDESVYCCYKYKQFESQSRSCNLVNIQNAGDTCKKKGTKERTAYESLLWRKVRAKMLKHPRIDLSAEWDQWTECICQDLIGIKQTEEDCKALVDKDDYPPCSLDFDNSQPSSGNWLSRCKWEEFKNLDIGTKMQMLYHRDQLLQYRPILGKMGDNCISKYRDVGLTMFQQPGMSITDCFGRLPEDNFILRTRDDCQNLKLENELGFEDVKLVYDFQSAELKNKVFCCYSWNQNKPCNFDKSARGEDILKKVCQGTNIADRAKFEEKFLRLVKQGNKPVSDFLTSFTPCICQLVGKDPKPMWNPQSCSLADLYPES